MSLNSLLFGLSQSICPAVSGAVSILQPFLPVSDSAAALLVSMTIIFVNFFCIDSVLSRKTDCLRSHSLRAHCQLLSQELCHFFGLGGQIYIYIYIYIFVVHVVLFFPVVVFFCIFLVLFFWLMKRAARDKDDGKGYYYQKKSNCSYATC